MLFYFFYYFKSVCSFQWFSAVYRVRIIKYFFFALVVQYTKTIRFSIKQATSWTNKMQTAILISSLVCASMTFWFDWKTQYTSKINIMVHGEKSFELQRRWQTSCCSRKKRSKKKTQTISPYLKSSLHNWIVGKSRERIVSCC